MRRRLDIAPTARLNAIPDAWVTHVATVAKQHFGGADLDGAALARAVADVSQTYTTERDALAQGRVRTADLVARLKWFSLRDLPKIELPLTELSIGCAQPSAKRLRVLDVGAGVGTTSLGVARWARRIGAEHLDVVALDRDEQALRVFEAIARDVTTLDATPITLRTVSTELNRAPTALADATFDLIVIGFVINELWPDLSASDRAGHIQQWLSKLSRQLTPDGAIVILEPALREQTRQLQQVRDCVVAADTAPFVFAPCLHAKPCPMLPSERDWCHVQAPFQLPKTLADVARMAGLRDHDLTFSSLTLRKQAGSIVTLAPTQPAPGEWQRVVSATLASKGKTELVVCGEPGLSRAMCLDRHVNDDNATFVALCRGAVVRLPLAADNGRIRVTAEDSVTPLLRW